MIGAGARGRVAALLPLISRFERRQPESGGYSCLTGVANALLVGLMGRSRLPCERGHAYTDAAAAEHALVRAG